MLALSKIKKLYHRLITSHATTEEIAEGFALGIFIGFTPTIGFHSIIALGLGALLKKNEIAALIGTWITNPLTIFPIYYFTFHVGLFLRGESNQIELSEGFLKNIFNVGADIMVPLWTGGLAIGFMAAFISYYLCLKIYPYLRQKQHQLREKIDEKLHKDGGFND